METVQLDFLGDLRRTHTCGQLRVTDTGKRALLMGWVHRRRDLGGVLFIHLRDRDGVTQIVFHADTELTLGARGVPQPPLANLAASLGDDEIAIAVVGAHLSGMVLNGELKALGGRLLEATVTAPDYRLYALDTIPPKPGMLRVEAGTGAAGALEIWALSAASFGKFVAAIPPPLSIGTV